MLTPAQIPGAKEKYYGVQIEIINLDKEDVILTSGDTDGSDIPDEEKGFWGPAV